MVVNEGEILQERISKEEELANVLVKIQNCAS